MASKNTGKSSKLVRDSFTIPKAEYLTIDALKTRAIAMGTSVKKSELLRAGLMVLKGMSDAAYKTAIAAVPTLKTGRPSAEAPLPKAADVPVKALVKARPVAKAPVKAATKSAVKPMAKPAAKSPPVAAAAPKTVVKKATAKKATAKQATAKKATTPPARKPAVKAPVQKSKAAAVVNTASPAQPSAAVAAKPASAPAA